MLQAFIDNQSFDIKPNIIETIVDVKIEITLSNDSQDIALKIFDELKTISPRDSFELFLFLDGDDVSIDTCLQSSLDKLQQHFNFHEGYAESSIVIDIRKELTNETISIYFIDEFQNYIKNEMFHNVYETISKHFTESLRFEVFSNIKNFGSSTISFYEYGSSPVLVVPNTNRTNILDLVVDNGITTNLVKNLLPSDFNITPSPALNEINEFFADINIILCLAFIANSSELSVSNEFSLKIHGYKSVVYKSLDFTKYRAQKKLLNEIYNWAYEGGSNSDKIGLIRNVFSIHTDNVGIFAIDDEVWLAIQSNHQIYLKGNVKSYLEVKGKIGDLLVQTTLKTYSIVEELLQSFKQNALVMITFIITTLLINGLKPIDNKIPYFSNVYLFALILLIVISIIWLFMIRSDSKDRFEVSASATKNIITLNYSSIVMPSEIDSIVNPIVDNNRIYLNNQICKYTKWWAFMIISIVICFGLANARFEKFGLLATMINNKPQKIEQPTTSKTPLNVPNSVQPVKIEKNPSKG
jgi:hypothetical protein